MRSDYDVVIIGGGPAGSTCGTLLKKYMPRLSVAIIEREEFPRDHVGESQLPVIGQVLNEMEVWDKVEAAGFPIKIGATYRWGRTRDLWNFEFLPNGELAPEARPSKYEGQRTQTAFQVDRARYDQILLDHAHWMGCDVFQRTKVVGVERSGDRVDSISVQEDDRSQPSCVRAKHYVDASGHTGVLRRAMGVETSSPTTLQNIAIWDYWQNAEWAVKIGVGGTRVQVLSLPYGWIWFIPMGPTRTSIGLIVPARYYKECGKPPRDLYLGALAEDDRVSALIKNATSEEKLSTTKDWSFVADRLTGENWFLAGESAGFADPILAAGMALAHGGARDVAYTILALERGDFEPSWLRTRYCEAHRSQIGSHIRFADFWYTQNGVFSDLQDVARDIAGDLGLNLSSEDAWRWFGQGGFINHDVAGTGFGGYSMIATKHVAASFVGDEPHYEVVGKTHFRLNLDGAEKKWGANAENGRITRHRSYFRNGKYLPNVGFAAWLMAVLKSERTFDEICVEGARYVFENAIPEEDYPNFRRSFLDMLEAMVSDGWVETRTVPGFRAHPSPTMDVSTFFHLDKEAQVPAVA